MKRSEMVDLMVSVMESFYHRQDPSFNLLSDFLLLELEKEGMLPPRHPGWVDYLDKYPRGYEWEPEND